ncbi:exopolygalacturonase [Amborella trichopoda]|uniref:exopolygalacturonase n=1 Tax=Amborella trichopoda TaxID=13333 RepID=UPI0005D2D6E8|nr:exopolygalacturonase [Amborella trichopoda]|eukprot:XP_011625087.1 exopolygalacturonase [Amborella trichopoda]
MKHFSLFLVVLFLSSTVVFKTAQSRSVPGISFAKNYEAQTRSIQGISFAENYEYEEQASTRELERPGGLALPTPSGSPGKHKSELGIQLPGQSRKCWSYSSWKSTFPAFSSGPDVFVRKRLHTCSCVQVLFHVDGKAPHSITNGEIRGISSVDSKLFQILLFRCKNMKVQSIKISAPGDSPNTDGIHIGSSSNISISQSRIGTGDDCISIGPGTAQVTVRDVFSGPGHGISVGSLGKFPKEEDVQGIHVENCTISDTTTGLRIKTWADSASSSASNFTYEDIVMNNVANPIIIDQQYCPYSSCPQKDPSPVKISDISFKNIRGTTSSKVAVNLLCSEAFLSQNVKLDDIKLEYNEQGRPSTASCTNVKGVSAGVQAPPTCL